MSIFLKNHIKSAKFMGWSVLATTFLVALFISPGLVFAQVPWVGPSANPPDGNPPGFLLNTSAFQDIDLNVKSLKTNTLTVPTTGSATLSVTSGQVNITGQLQVLNNNISLNNGSLDLISGSDICFNGATCIDEWSDLNDLGIGGSDLWSASSNPFIYNNLSGYNGINGSQSHARIYNATGALQSRTGENWVELVTYAEAGPSDGATTNIQFGQDPGEKLKVSFSPAPSVSTNIIYFHSSGDVSIGTSVAAAKLDVYKTGYGSSPLFKIRNDQGQELVSDFVDATNAYVGTTGAHNLQLRTNNTPRVTMLSGGNVGIGTTNPGSNRLHVAGAVFTDGPITVWPNNTLQSYGSLIFNTDIDSGSADSFIFQDTGVEKVRIVGDSGRVGIGTNNPLAPLDVRGNAGFSSRICLGDNGTACPIIGNAGTAGIWFESADINEFFFGKIALNGNLGWWNNAWLGAITPSGNFGIGNTSPSYKLDVAGPANLNTTLGDIVLRVNGVEALWYGSSPTLGHQYQRFSWGYGGIQNYFNDPIGIGPTGMNILDLDINGDIARPKLVIEQDQKGVLGASPYYQGIYIKNAGNGWSLVANGDHDNGTGSTHGFGVWAIGKTVAFRAVGPSIFNGSVTIQNGSQGAGKVLTSDVNGLATWQPLPSGGVTGIGTVNYIAKFTSPTAVGNSTIFDNGTNVGIGTTVPGTKLELSGAGTQVARITSTGGASNYPSLELRRVGASNNDDWQIITGQVINNGFEGLSFNFSTSDGGSWLPALDITRTYLRTRGLGIVVHDPIPSNNPRIIVQDSTQADQVYLSSESHSFFRGGNLRRVGIGTSVPAGGNLNVVATGPYTAIRAQASGGENGTTPGTVPVAIYATATGGTNGAAGFFQGRLVADSICFGTSLSTTDCTSSWQNVGLWTANGSNIYRLSNVGIGITSPTASLDVTRGTATGGTAQFRGTNYTSHFNYSTAEHTYIRGGKPNSTVYLNDGDDGGWVVVGSTAKTAATASNNSVLQILTGDTLWSGLEARGNSQGTGYLFVGQSGLYGGGMFYNGDLATGPSFASGEVGDRVSFYRMNNGTRYTVFDYGYNSDEVNFRGGVSIGTNTVTPGYTASIKNTTALRHGLEIDNSGALGTAHGLVSKVSSNFSVAVKGEVTDNTLAYGGYFSGGLGLGASELHVFGNATIDNGSGGGDLIAPNNIWGDAWESPNWEAFWEECPQGYYMTGVEVGLIGDALIKCRKL